jgi:hypothetical protein
VRGKRTKETEEAKETSQKDKNTRRPPDSCNLDSFESLTYVADLSTAAALCMCGNNEYPFVYYAPGTALHPLYRMYFRNSGYKL